MKNTIRIAVTRTGRAWQWSVYRGRSLVGGGYCRTKRDAMSDASILAGIGRVGR